MAKPMLFKALENQWGTTAFKKQNVLHFAEESLKLSKNGTYSIETPHKIKTIRHVQSGARLTRLSHEAK